MPVPNSGLAFFCSIGCSLLILMFARIHLYSLSLSLLFFIALLLSISGFIPRDLQVEAVRKGAYWFLLINSIFVCAVFFRNFFVDGKALSLSRFWQVLASHRWGIGASIFCVTLQLCAVSFTYKTLADEHVIAGSAKQMHETRLYQNPQQVHTVFDREETLLWVVDKRPPLYSFLISLVHGIVGFHFLTPVYLNAFLLFPFMLLIYALTVDTWDRLSGAFAVLVVGTLPLLGYVFVSGALMPLNLCLIFLCFYFVRRFLQAPSVLLYALVLFTFSLLIQARYESVLFFPLLLLPILYRWHDKASLSSLLSWPLPVFLFFVIPRVWHHSVFVLNESVWESESSPFAVSHIFDNWDLFMQFLFSLEASNPSSLVLGIFGSLGVLISIAFYLTGRWRFRISSDSVAWVSLGAGVFLLFLLLLSYSWSISGPVTVRLTLPILVFLGIFGGVLLSKFFYRWSSLVTIALVCLIWMFVLPVQNRAAYHQMNRFSREFVELKKYVEETRSEHGYRTFVSDNVSFFYLLGENATNVKFLNLKTDFYAEYVKLKNAGRVFMVRRDGFDYSRNEMAPYQRVEKLDERFKTTVVDTIEVNPNWTTVISEIVSVDVSNDVDVDFGEFDGQRRFRMLVP